ncbi:MAG: hypothetical protein M3Q71_14700 [Chloroflexota bacterium]|nr:hypothetical protein [Chloroflexota bacterium]
MSTTRDPRPSKGTASGPTVRARLKRMRDAHGREFLRLLCGRSHPCPGLLGEADRYTLVAHDDGRLWDEEPDTDPPMVLMGAVDRLGPTWVVGSPPPLPLAERGTPDAARRAGDFAYRGYADSGYHVLRPDRKRGRRPLSVIHIVGVEKITSRSIVGQRPTLPCHIFCPVCNTPNEVPEPDTGGGG